MNRTALQLIRTELIQNMEGSSGSERARFELALEELEQLAETRYAARGRRKKAGTRKKTAKKKKTARKKAGTRKKAGARKKKKKTAAGGTTRVRRGRRGRPGGTVIQAMRDSIRALSGTFTVADVKGRMPSAMTRNTKPAVFSTTLKRLEDLGEIRVVKRGRGRRATTYKK